MEKKMERNYYTVMGYVGIAIRIHSFIPGKGRMKNRADHLSRV